MCGGFDPGFSAVAGTFCRMTVASRAAMVTNGTRPLAQCATNAATTCLRRERRDLRMLAQSKCVEVGLMNGGVVLRIRGAMAVSSFISHVTTLAGDHKSTSC